MENARMEIMPICRGKRDCLILQCCSYSSVLQFSFEFLSIVMHGGVPLPIESLMWKSVYTLADNYVALFVPLINHCTYKFFSTTTYHLESKFWMDLLQPRWIIS